MTETTNLLGPVLLGAKIFFLLLLYLFIWRMVRSMSRGMARGAEPMAMPAGAPSAPPPVAAAPARPAATPAAPPAAASVEPAAPPAPAPSAGGREAEDAGLTREFDYLVDQLQPRLVVQHSALVEDGSTFKLSGGATIGRSPGSDIVLPDEYVSSTHARIFARRQFYFIEDLGSTNGTFIDGRRIEGEHQIKPGQEIVIGDTIFRYEE